MKTVKEIQDSRKVLIGQLVYDGFNGEIHMHSWTGSVVASWGGGWEHVSVCPRKKHIVPSWDDMCKIKDIFFHDEECVVQYHPPKSEYVNNMPNCLHLWRPINEAMPMPPSIMVGIKNGQKSESVKTELLKLMAELI